MNLFSINNKQLVIKTNSFHQILFFLLLFFSFNSYACNKSTATLVSETDNGNGTYTYVVNVCLELGDMIGVPNTFTLTPSGGTYTSLTTTTPASFNNAGTIYNKSVAGAIISYTTNDMFPNSTPNVWCVPQVTFTTNGRPSKITVNTSDRYGAATCDHVLNIPSCSPPATPTSTTIAATCLSAGTSTISNYSATNAYTFTPVGPTVGAGGSISGMVTGTSYTVIASAGGCSSTASTSFNNAAQLTAPATPTSTLTQPTCATPTGTITITAPLGAFTYNNNGGAFQAGTTFSGLAPNTYTVIAKNASGCTSTANFTINAVPGGPATPTATLTQPTCSLPTGTIVITAPIGAFTYNLNGGTFQAGTTFTGLTPNTYTIIAKDAGGCTSTANFTISPIPSPPATPTATLTQPTCTTSTGTIAITAPLGAITYNLNGGAFQAGTTFTGLTPNTYTIIAKDAGGCTSTSNFTINTVPSGPIAPTATLTQPTCSVSTGTILITTPTGAGYTYNINGGAFQAGTTFSGLSANTYTIIVKDASGCTSTANVTLNNPPGAPAVATTTLIQPTCAIPTGTITVTAPIGAFTYSINGGSFQAGTSFSGLAPANYTVTVKDAGGCTSTTNVTVNAVPSPSTPTFSLTQPTCLVNTGTITLTAPLGAYTYSINGVTFQAGTVFSGLAANTYTVSVKDASGCVGSSPAIITPPGGAPSSATSTLTQPTCLVNTGSISVTAPLGAYTYSIDGNVFQAGTSFNGLAPNTYTITVKDGIGCTSTTNVTITTVPGAPAIPTLTVTNPTCGGTTGSITVSSPLGAFTYSSDGVIFQAGTAFAGLVPNNYTITVKDASGCTTTNTATINAVPPTPAVETSTLTQPTCLAQTGTITITSPIGAYTYSIDGVTFQAGAVFSGLTPKAYSITVKNASNCISTNTETILPVPPGPINPTATLLQPTCLIPTGSITVTAPIGAYTYSINGVAFQAGVLFSGLASGNYTITAKDAIGCTSTSNFLLNPLPANPVNPTLTVTQPTCQITTGTIFITAPLGAYTYSKDGVTFQVGTFFNALPANASYTITVKDAGGCTSTAQATVNPQLVIPAIPTATITHASCTSATGSFNVATPIAAGNVYSIDGVVYKPGTTFTGLAPNGYTLSVKNSDGCISSSLITINVPPNPPAAPFVLPKHPDCTVKTGEISVISPLGAAMTYSLDSITFQSSNNFDSLVTGNHTIYVKDGNNCVSKSLFTINAQPITPKASFTYTPTELNILNPVVNFTNHSINATSYKWSFEEGAKQITTVNPVYEFPPTPNVYFVKLTAYNNNCSDDTIVPITIIETPIIYVPNSFTPNGDEVNNSFFPVIAGGIANENYTFYIFNRWGELIFESHNKDYGWDGTYGNKICMPDTYIWKIEYRENTGNKMKKYLVGHVNLIN